VRTRKETWMKYVLECTNFVIFQEIPSGVVDVLLFPRARGKKQMGQETNKRILRSELESA